MVLIPGNYLASSQFGVRGCVQMSSLLPSDAEQMLRVRKSMAHAGHRVCVSFFAARSLCEEASFMSRCFFDELSINDPDIQQLQRLLSQDWICSWGMWRSIQSYLDKCKSTQMRQWTSQHAVQSITSPSLSQMVVSFPSYTGRCMQLTREGVVTDDTCRCFILVVCLIVYCNSCLTIKC